ncbi:MAG: hypothetical protein JO097_08020 [Acidobacteriaceae bacterium]|nr:hypothetical protein [Acidobacteriaceae bacterium]MBV9296498.1 hypothetical protein [Acidobacteriaceae bacterium]MBV9765199.1 hypothetical protein [Acidobacteriaceae bacterium]
MPDERLLIRAEEQLASMRIREALRLFRLAERAGCDPDSCAAGRWTCYMLCGDFESAWRESDAISNRGKPDPHRFWDGRPVHGRTVLIRCLHGLGDSIQFLRYAPLIRGEARRLIIEAQPTLKSLIQQSGLADEVITWGEPEPHWDQQIEIIELPRIFRTSVDSIPNHVPYLHAPVGPYERSRPIRVGIVWASSVYNPARSVPLQEMAELFTVPGASFFTLQGGIERAQLEPWSKQIIDLYDESACVLAAAKNLNGLDLVISVDTMIAHLAGAMARPVWTLLPYECDWRWMLNRDDSPWYPTMRLFRQTSHRNWHTVIQRVRRALEQFVSTGSTAFPDRLNGQHHQHLEHLVREA